MKTLTATDRLLVSRQDPGTRSYTRVGELRHDGDQYVFTYDHEITRPLPGLPLGAEHRSSQLFPVFDERVISPLRADRKLVMEQLGLDNHAGPFEVLAVSGGARAGDTYEVTPIPDPGPVELPFLVHGIRHLQPNEQDHIGRLAIGQQLSLNYEPTNPVNPRAVIVSSDGVRLGYVPDPLVDSVRRVMENPYQLKVVRVNPQEAGFHMRLLVVLEGQLTD